MANLIKPKRSTVASKVPTTSDIVSGEIAINSTDQKIYTNNGSAVVQIGAGKLSALGEVVITTPSTNQVLKYDGTNWINGTDGGGDVVGPASATDNAIARYDGTTGKLIQNSTVTLDDNGNLVNVNAVGFDTTPTSPPTAAGSMFWDTGNGTPSVVLNANTTLQLGQENIALVYNGTGSTIPNGSVVAVSGAQGQRPSVVLADADSEPYSAATLGIATENIANGAEGFICTFGLVRGLDTSAFTDGQPIWLSQTAGQFTATKPPAPAHLVFLGWVVKVNASSGEVFVHISNGWELDELHNVLITSPVNGNLLAYDATAGVWKNTNTIANNTVIEVNNTTDALRINQTGTGNALVVEDSANPDSTPFVVNKDGSVISGYTSYDSSWFSSGNAPTIWQVANTSNRVGFGSINYNGPGGLSLFRAGGGVIGTEGSVASGDIVGAVTFAGYDGVTSNAIPTAVIRSDVDGTPGTNDMPGRLVFSTTADGGSSSTERMRIDSSGNVGIGTTSPQVQLWRTGATLTVQGTTAGNIEVSSSRADGAGVAVGAVEWAWTAQDATHKHLALIEVDSEGATAGQRGGAMKFFTKANGTAAPAERMRVFSSGGVAIGNTTDPGNKGIFIGGAIMENVFTITDGAAFEIDPGNGTIQLITLGASRTPKATNFAAGEAITLMVDDGSAYTIIWTDTTFGTGGVVWETDGGTAPTLSTSGYTTIVLWKVGTQVYGARVGNN